MSGTDELGTITVQKHERVSAGMSAKKQQHTAEAPEQYSVTVNRITGFVLFRSLACKQCLCMCICVCMGISLNKLFRLLLMKLQADPLTF